MLYVVGHATCRRTCYYDLPGPGHPPHHTNTIRSETVYLFACCSFPCLFCLQHLLSPLSRALIPPDHHTAATVIYLCPNHWSSAALSDQPPSLHFTLLRLYPFLKSTVARPPFLLHAIPTLRFEKAWIHRYRYYSSTGVDSCDYMQPPLPRLASFLFLPHVIGGRVRVPLRHYLFPHFPLRVVFVNHAFHLVY